MHLQQKRSLTIGFEWGCETKNDGKVIWSLRSKESHKIKQKGKKMDIRQPEKIYDYVSENVDNLIIELRALESSNDNENTDSEKEEALNILEQFKNQILVPSINDLKQNQEWDTYTIAFYGETNAGKSTIIETMRIHFGEETKSEMQSKFVELHNDYTIKIEAMKKALMEIKLDECQVNNFTTTDDIYKQYQEIQKYIGSLKELENKKKKNSLWYRLLSFFNANHLTKKVILLDSLFLEIDNFQMLHQYTDGNIIGDGRSDFTQKATQYLFNVGSQKFAIIDVPGIEGKEDQVMKEILESVSKAHTVFYVTSNPTPPQSGDKTNQGTLNKIKAHLNAQTEVYTIFNKRINNPMQLEKQLISDDEYASLGILNEKMTEVLGENYINHIGLSAQVVFLALAEHLVSDSKYSIDRHKFLSKTSKDALLEKSLFNDFSEFITEDLINNTQAKIKKSNFNKANNVVKQLNESVHLYSDTKLKPIYIELSNECNATKQKLNGVLKTTKIKLNSSVKKAIETFKNEAIEKIYAHIENNVSNDSFKQQLSLLVKEGQERITLELPSELDKEFKKLDSDIKENLKTFEKRATKTLSSFNKIDIDTNGAHFELDINISNGINKWGVAGSLIGAGGLYATVMATNAWNPLGWTMLALGAVSVLISFAKAIGGFFSSSYKMDQQREQASDNIDNISDQIEKVILDKIKSAYPEIDKLVNELNAEIDKKANHIKTINDLVEEFIVKLDTLSKQINTEGSI